MDEGDIMLAILDGNSKYMRQVRRLVKYCATGLINTALTYVVYSGFTMMGTSRAWALAIGYVLGMIASYLINAKWTFRQSTHSTGQLFRFLGVNLVILGIGELSLRWILAHLTVSPYVGQAINLIPTTLLGFAVNQGIVFRRKT